MHHLLSKAAGLVMLLGLPAFAAADGTVELKGLPPGAHVYVNGRAAQLVEGRLSLAPGSHTVQVEAIYGGEVQAYRRVIRVLHGQPERLEIALIPVRPTGYPILLPGARGPGGPPGPPGPPLPAPSAFSGLSDLTSPIRTALSLEIQRIRDRLGQPTVARGPKYYVLPGAEKPDVIPGTPGPRGPVGLIAPPDEAWAVLDPDGKPLLKEAMRRLQLPELREAADHAAAVGSRVTEAGSTAEERGQITLLTPGLKQKVEQYQDPSQLRHIGLAAPMGPRGPRGPTVLGGIRPRPLEKVRLSPERTREVLQAVTSDESLRTSLEALRRAIELAAEDAP